jgi:ABC-2 type transport system ATP-binding protein
VFLRSILAALISACLVSSMTAAAGAEAEPKIVNPIVVESFDGTPIVATLMLPAEASRRHRVPVVFQTHGWGGTREESPGGFTARLLENGYAVLTWDSRGFGDSGGEANVDSPEFEVRDAQALIDFVAKRPEILTDAPGDPRMGWIGGSYAGGIQLNTAAVDARPDAIIPEIAWADLVQDLYPNRVIKKTWDQLLYAAGAAAATGDGLDSPAGPQTGVYAQEIHQAEVMGSATGEFPEDVEKWFAARSTIINTPKITAPTMIIQGTVDTLFPLEDAFAHYAILKRNGVPVKLVTYCAGHTLGCSYPGGASGYPEEEGSEKPPIYEDRMLAWLDRHVKGVRGETGPEIEWQAQDGFYYGASRYPLRGTRMIEAKAVETGTLVGPGPTGGDGPADGNPAPDFELGGSAARAVILEARKKETPIVGVPRVRLTGEATGVTAFAFFELVDEAPDGTLTTVDDQTMPIRLASGEVKETLALHGVSWLLKPGHKLLLEVTTGSTQYDIPRTGPFAVSLKAVTKLPLTKLRGNLRPVGSRPGSHHD